ncbi:hypothetical protein D1872_70870 [compost metagenome]
MISNQERLWRERSIEKQPVYYDYPKEGFDCVVLCEKGEVTLVQINEYAVKKKKYYVSGKSGLIIATYDRSEADAEYQKAIQLKRSYKICQ